MDSNVLLVPCRVRHHKAEADRQKGDKRESRGGGGGRDRSCLNLPACTCLCTAHPHPSMCMKCQQMFLIQQGLSLHTGDEQTRVICMKCRQMFLIQQGLSLHTGDEQTRVICHCTQGMNRQGSYVTAHRG